MSTALYTPTGITLHGYFGDSAVVYRSELSKYMEAYSEGRPREAQTKALTGSQANWTRKLKEARDNNPYQYNETDAELSLTSDKRVLPKRAWEGLFSRFGTMYPKRYTLELGPGEIDEKSGREGSSINIYLGMTGERLCTTNIGHNSERPGNPTRIDALGVEIELWAERRGINPSAFLRISLQTKFKGNT